MTPPNVSALSWRIVALAGLVLAAYVVLTIFGADTSSLVSVVVALATGGSITVHAAQRLDTQDKKLDTITHQTNGVLTKRIKDAVAQALAERDNPEPTSAKGKGKGKG